jgi:hypothetical protein
MQVNVSGLHGYHKEQLSRQLYVILFILRKKLVHQDVVTVLFGQYS